MVYGIDLFFALFNNLAIFIAIVTIYSYLLRTTQRLIWYKRQAIIGITFGILAIGCMYAKIPVFEGVIVDQRNAIITLSGAIAGPLSAIFTAILATGFRLYLGGAGSLAGVIGITLSAVAGTGLNRYSRRFESVHKASMSALIASFVILPGFLFVGDIDTGWKLMKAMTLPYGSAIFLGVFLGGLLLHREEERYQTELLLRESEGKYRELIEGTRDLVTRMDKYGNFTFVNHVAEEILGIPPKECIGLSAFSFIHPDDRDQTKRWFERCVAERTLQAKIENRQVNAKTGKSHVVLWSSAFHFDEAGDLVGVGGIAHDLTEYKRAEEALRTSEENYRKLFNELPDVFYRTDCTGHLILASPSLRNVLGYTVEEAVGMDVAKYLYKDPAQRDVLLMKLNEFGFVEGFEAALKHKNGSIVWVAANSRLYYDGSGNVLGVEGNFRDITERKRAEEALRESEELYRNLFDTSLVGLWRTRIEDGKFIRSNRANADILGISDPDELVRNYTASEFYSPERRNELIELLKRDKQVSNFEVDLALKDGAKRSISISAKMFPEQGYIEGAIVDITDRKRAEEALKEVAELLAATLESTADGILAVNEEGKVVSANTKFREMWRIPNVLMATEDDAKLLDHVLDQLLEPQAFLGKVKELYASSKEDLDTLLFKDGRVFERFSCPLIRDGNISGRVWSFRDVTSQKKAEEALRESEQQYRLLAENVSDVIFTTDLDLNVTYISPSAENMHGWTTSEWSFLKPADYLPPASLELVLKTLSEEIALQGIPEADPNRVRTLEIEQCRKDGTTFWTEVSSRFLYDDNGAPCGLIGATRDISERKQAEEERKALQTQLNQAQKMESVGRLAGGVAHDFNNMLGVILGNAELALKEISSEQRAYNSLQEILKATHRSANLTRQLLAFARKQTISPKVLDINETVESMLKMVRRLIGEDVELLWKPSVGVWAVKVDPTQIDQILANLCVNARDAIAGVGKVTIETRNVLLDNAFCREHAGASPGDYVLLAVSDTGCGMAKDVLDKLFEPFFTTKEIGKGTGLGLATVYGIVRQNNGFIDVQSEPGRGTTFSIYLPRTDIPISQGESYQEQDRNLKGGETVLLVEDEEAILELGKRTLEHYGYLVLAARHPVEALDLVKRYPGQIDLLITDVIMPSMTGKELIERLSGFKTGFRSIYISGYTDDVIAQHGVLEEGVHFLQKPFSIQSLAAKVREVLDG